MVSKDVMLEGKSRARAQGRFLQPPDKSEAPAAIFEGEAEQIKKRPKRHASVYDAVAGRVGLNGFITKNLSAFDDEAPSTRVKPLAPEEVLLRRVRAPTHVPLGYYDADEELPSDQRLPDSDLLKAIHAYASDFYSMATPDQGRCDFRSMNETALLAMGVLLEEAAVEVLGETGDMVLVEPEGLENAMPEERVTRHQIKGRVRPIATPELEAESEEEVTEQDIEEAGERKRKRRRLNMFV